MRVRLGSFEGFLKKLMVQHSMRPTCHACLRPQTTCICHLIPSVYTDIEVLILQHPLEVFETKGTARLLHLSLSNSQILTGEIFDEALFISSKQSILLYPVTPEEHSINHHRRYLAKKPKNTYQKPIFANTTQIGFAKFTNRPIHHPQSA
jgi:DTW domain-containing protein YfiP